MKKTLLLLAAGAYFMSTGISIGASYKINGDDADTPRDIGNEMFKTEAYYSQINDSSGWVDIPLADRVLPDFDNDTIKLDNINITLTGTVNMKKFEGLYNSNLTFTGADTVATLTDNIWADGISYVNVLDGATLSTSNDLCANRGISKITISGSATNKSTFNGGLSDVDTNVSFDNATWTNDKRGTSVNIGATVTFNNTNWTNSAGGLNINLTNDASKLDQSTIVELKDSNVVEISGNIQLGSSEATGGTSTLLVSGNNNSLTAHNLEGPTNGRSGGDAALKVTGNNNTVFINGGNINIDGYVPGNSVTGGTQGVEIAGEGNVFKATNRISLGRNDGGTNFLGGGSYFKISSSNAENTAKLSLGNDVNIGLGDTEASTYTAEFAVGGNTVVRALDGTSAVGTINVGSGGPSTPTGGKAIFNVSGSNNDILVTNINVMHIGASGNAAGYFNILGSNNKVVVNDGLRISSMGGLEENPNSNGNGYVTIAGTNNTLQENGITIIGNHDNSTAGFARFEVAGSGNNVLLNNVNLGAGTNVTGGNGRMVINGSGNNITVSGHFNCWSPAAASEDISLASGFEFIMDSSSVSTVVMDGGNNLWDAYYFIDLTNLVGSFDESTNGKWTLVSAINDFNFDSDKVVYTLREGDDEFAAALNKETDDSGRYVLTLYYNSVIPEPSTYAAIFGALALAFAAYRRRR